MPVNRRASETALIRARGSPEGERKDRKEKTALILIDAALGSVIQLAKGLRPPGKGIEKGQRHTS